MTTMEATPSAATTTQTLSFNRRTVLLTRTDDSTRTQKSHLQTLLQAMTQLRKAMRAQTVPQHMKQKRYALGSLAHPGPEPRRTTIPWPWSQSCKVFPSTSRRTWCCSHSVSSASRRLHRISRSRFSFRQPPLLPSPTSQPLSPHSSPSSHATLLLFPHHPLLLHLRIPKRSSSGISMACSPRHVRSVATSDTASAIVQQPRSMWTRVV
jgi:hypothetical protein